MTSWFQKAGLFPLLILVGQALICFLWFQVSWSRAFYGTLVITWTISGSSTSADRCESSPYYFLVLSLVYVIGPVGFRMIDRGDLVKILHPETQAFAWLYMVNVAMSFSIPITSLLGHFWSLCIEEHFYFVWPFVIRNLGRTRIIRICAWMIFSSLVLRFLFYLNHFGFAAYALTVCRIDALAIGAGIALVSRH